MFPFISPHVGMSRSELGKGLHVPPGVSMLAETTSSWVFPPGLLNTEPVGPTLPLSLSSSWRSVPQCPLIFEASSPGTGGRRKRCECAWAQVGAGTRIHGGLGHVCPCSRHLAGHITVSPHHSP